MTLHWSTVKHARDNVCEPHEGTFARLFKHLDMARARAMRSPSTEKINGRGLVPATFLEGVHPEKPGDYPGVQRWRKLELVDRVWLCILDIDDASCEQAVILEAWQGCSLIHWSTYSHGVPGHGLRMRVVLPYARPLSTHEHRLVYRWAVERMHAAGVEAEAVTTQTSDPTRVFFGPGNVSPASTATPWLELVEGDTLDPDALPGGGSVGELVVAHAKTTRRSVTPPSAPIGLHPYVVKALEEECARVASATEGHRTATLWSAAAQLGELVAGGVLDEATARAHLVQAAAATGLGQKEIDRNVDRGLAKGADAPRRPPESNVVPFRRDVGERDIKPETEAAEATEQLDADAEPGTYTERAPVLGVIASAPVAAAACVPRGFALAQANTWYRKLDKHGVFECWQRCAFAPVVLSAILEDVDEGTVLVRLSFRRRGRWKHLLVERAEIKSTRKIVELAGRDLAVDQSCAPLLVRYLSAYEAENEAHIPRARVSQSMGWQVDGSFLMGASEALEGDPLKWSPNMVAFRASTGGVEQLAEAIARAGTLEQWAACLEAIAPFPKVRLALYASLAVPLLFVLRTRSFVVDWSFATSTGKTTLLRLAASCWGRPHGEGAYVRSWDSTRVWIERAAATMRDLPLILDDTKRARSPRVVAQTLYDIVDGQGRGRGSLSGTQRTTTWRTILLSTGEQPATSFSQDGGTRARTLTVWGVPFERTDMETARLVQALNSGLLEHHGHAGPALVAYLRRQRKQWPAWRKRFAEVHRTFIEAAEGDAVAGRLAEHLALLDVAARTAHAALPLPFDYDDTVTRLRADIIGEVRESDPVRDALELAIGWAQANEHRFVGRGDAQRPPAAGWAGRWDTNKREINWFPHVLAKLLEEAGHSHDAMLRLWRDRGWLVCSGDRKRTTKKVRINLHGEQGRTRCNVMSEAALDLVSPCGPTCGATGGARNPQGHDSQPKVIPYDF